jgi:hypothetical protein
MEKKKENEKEKKRKKKNGLAILDTFIFALLLVSREVENIVSLGKLVVLRLVDTVKFLLLVQIIWVVLSSFHPHLRNVHPICHSVCRHAEENLVCPLCRIVRDHHPFIPPPASHCLRLNFHSFLKSPPFHCGLNDCSCFTT